MRKGTRRCPSCIVNLWVDLLDQAAWEDASESSHRVGEAGAAGVPGVDVWSNSVRGSERVVQCICAAVG